MYGTQHRGLPSNRLSELLDQVRQEFDGQSRSSEHYENQVNGQIQEMEMIRSKIFQLEQAQIKMKNEYDAEVKTLRQELDNARAGGMPSHMGNQPQYGSASQPQPPALGHGPSNLFSGIMANSGQGGPGLAPPPSQDQQPPPQQQHPLQPPIPGPQQAGPPPAQPQGPFQGYQTGPPAINGYTPQPPQPASSPGMNKNRPSNRGPPGPATPQQGQLSYPDPRASPQIGRPPGTGLNPHPPFRASVGNVLADIDPETAPDHLKRQGTEWFAVFNPDVPRILDVNLIHNLVHESVVCCVRFSIDGRYVATGCNRSAQIFDVASGQQVSILQDETVLDKDGDLYIRSVCFSPDGKLLATGAEDKLIRVRRHHCTRLVIINMCDRFGISNRRRFATSSPATTRTFIPSTSPETDVTLLPAVATRPFACGISTSVNKSWSSASRTESPPSPSPQMVATSPPDLSTVASASGIPRADT